MNERSTPSEKHSEDHAAQTNAVPKSSASRAPETIDQETPERTPQSMTEEIARLLRDDGPPAPTEASSPRSENENASEPLADLNAVAKRLGVDVASLYDIEIPLATDGERIKLGELKDRHRDTVGLETEQLRIEQRRQEIDAELMKGRAELREIIASLPRDALKPEIFNIAKQQLEGRKQRETRSEREVIPEWADVETRRTELAQINDHLAKYGLSSAWLENQLDHRLAKYVRDQWKRAQHVEKVLARVQPVKRPPTTISGEPSRKSKQGPHTATRDTAKLTRQVASLLSGDE